MTVFSPEWFELHQGKLLWLLNHWVTRAWFRWVLRIKRCDLARGRSIVTIQPHAYTVHLEGNKFATEIRSHNKFAKRLYYAFLPVWWFLHFWDWIIADRYDIPKLSFGFSTLLVFPQPGSGGSNVTCDYNLQRNPSPDEDFVTIATGAGTASSSSSPIAAPRLISGTTADAYNGNRRNYFNFDTYLPGVNLTQAMFSVWLTSKATALGSPDHHVCGSIPNSTASGTVSDYENATQRTSFGSVANASIVLNGYNDHNLNASGLSWINTTGITSLCTMMSWDVNLSFTGAWAASSASGFTTVMADSLGTDQDPKLTLVYTISGRFTNQGAKQIQLGAATRPALFKPGRAH